MLLESLNDVSGQNTHHRSKAVFLVLLVLSGGLLVPLSGGTQSDKFLSNAGANGAGEQLFKTYSSEIASTPQNGAGLYLFDSGGEISATSGSIPVASNPTDSQFLQEVTSGISPQQLVDSPIAAVLILRDAQTGQNRVVLIDLGQNVLSSRVSPIPFLFAPLLQVWLDSERRRSRFRIYVEILDLLKLGPMTPYEVAFHLRLNRKKAREYLEFLKKNSFLESVEYEGRATYVITPVGKTFVENLKSILEAERR
jgi:predicted transcriptional regulator